MSRLPITAARAVIAAGERPRLDDLPCLCGALKSAHSGAASSGGCADTGCAKYRRSPAHQLAAQALAIQDRTLLDDIRAAEEPYQPASGTARRRGARPSDFGACKRKIWYRETRPELADGSVDDLALVQGRIIHEIIAPARGYDRPWLRFEIPVRPPGLSRGGRVDEYDPLLGVVTDYKSASPASWERIGEHGANIEHFKQEAVYALALEDQGEHVATLCTLYLNKLTWETAAFVLPYDRGFAQDALDELLTLNMAIEADHAPARKGRNAGDGECVHCPFAADCWNLAAAKAAGRSPESYTFLGAGPSAKEIEWAASLVYASQKSKSESTKDWESARTLIDGLPEGTYGEYELVRRTREVNDYIAYAAQIERIKEEYLSWPEELRGDFFHWIERIEIPKRIDRWTEVKRVRAEKRNRRKIKPQTTVEAPPPPLHTEPRKIDQLI